MTFWFDFSVEVVKNTMDKRDCYINAGVYVVDLRQYKVGYSDECFPSIWCRLIVVIIMFTSSLFMFTYTYLRDSYVYLY